MGENRKQDATFFKSLTKQMDNGGYEALLYHLQNVDISEFEVRNVPQTDALQEQKLMSMGVEEEWWYHKLWDGRVLQNHDTWVRDVPTDALEQDYTAYADKWKFARRGNATLLGRFLNRVVPHINKMQKRVTVEEYDNETGQPHRTKKRMYHYDLGDLDKCRESWDKVYGVREWPTPVELELGDIEVPF